MSYPRRNILATGIATAVLAAAVVIGVIHLRVAGRQLVTIESHPLGIMGTRTALTVVVPADKSEAGQAALASATGTLRDVEAMMSSYLNASPVSQFNTAKAGVPVPIPPPLAWLLKRSRRFTRLSDGGFDVTVGPIVRLWKRAGKADKLPTSKQLADARSRVGMQNIVVTDGKAIKKINGVELDLGAIAKGYGVDRAAEAMKRTPGVRGGVVNVGGELRIFGVKPDGKRWRIGIQHPFRKGHLCGQMLLGNAAVATSGDYDRFETIHGRRYSHIVNPRTAMPIRGSHSVTIVIRPRNGKPPSCTDADAWATALSVMGPAGLKKLKGTGIEAMVITGPRQKPKITMTPGFAALLVPGTKIELNG